MTDPHVSPHCRVIEIDLSYCFWCDGDGEIQTDFETYVTCPACEAQTSDTMTLAERREWLTAHGLGWLEEDQ